MLKITSVFSLCILCSCSKPDPNTRLMDAAESGSITEVKAALAEGAKINFSSSVKFGWTPLLAAVFHNNTNVIPHLLDAGANINYASKSGETPLMMAVSRGDDSVELVKYLIDKGADLYRQDNSGQTVFDLVNSVPPKPKIVSLLTEIQKSRQLRNSTNNLQTNPK